MEGASAVFAISADRCPGVLCRVLALFAQQDRIVRRLEASDTGHSLDLVVEAGGLNEAQAALIAQRMNAVISVREAIVRIAG